MKSQRIAIIGGGIGGLSAALALTKAGFSVQVFEQAPELTEVGAGIQLSPNATQILQHWGLYQDAKRIGFLPKAIKFSHWRSGEQIGRFPINHSELFHHSSYMHIHRADLHELLYRRFLDLNPDGLVTGAKLQQVEYDAQAKTSRLSFESATPAGIKGSEDTFNVVVGADGIHSKVREMVAPHSQARFTGNVAWRGLVPTDELSPSCRPDPCANVVMGPGAHFVCYYVRGGKTLNYVAVVERDDWQEESWTIKASHEEMMEDFSGWNAQIRDILGSTAPDSCYRWALHDREPLKHWHKDQCLLIGDAAHPMLPFLAQGAAMALEDAFVLATCFTRHADASAEAIKQFVSLRQARATRVQLEARKNMKIYHMRNPLIQFARDQYLFFLSNTRPEYFNRRLQWLYSYDLCS